MIETPNDELAAMTALGGAERMAKVYRRIRDARAVASKEAKEKDAAFKAQLEILEGHMLLFLQATKQTSARTAEGTITRVEDIIPTASDWDLVYRWIVENDAFEALEKRLTKTFIRSWMNSHEGGIPPGVSVLRKYGIEVRKPTGKAIKEEATNE